MFLINITDHTSYAKNTKVNQTIWPFPIEIILNENEINLNNDTQSYAEWQPRIVGGTEAASGQFKGIVRLSTLFYLNIITIQLFDVFLNRYQFKIDWVHIFAAVT